MKRRKRLYPGIALKKARECIANGKVAFESHASRQLKERRIYLQDIIQGIADPRAGVIHNETRFMTRREVWSYRLRTYIEDEPLIVVVMFYLPEDSEDPDVLSVITAFFERTPNGQRPEML